LADNAHCAARRGMSAVLLCLAAMPLAGCATVAGLLGWLTPTQQEEAPAVPGIMVDTGFAASLDKAPEGTVAFIKQDSGPDVALALGPPYDSARGTPCRTAVSDKDILVRAFCSISGRWYAIPPMQERGDVEP
jgi:hypothetical protein